MNLYRADLHIHTALSPCAAKEMTPPRIVREAIRKGLSMIAVCDHNSAENAASVQAAATDGLAVISGIEITTVEEVHVLGLFPDSAAAGRVSEIVCSTLRGDNAAHHFGEQLLMDAAGKICGQQMKLLAAASGFSLEQAIGLINAHGGIAVASHVDRPSFSVFSQLGTIPENADFDAIEISDAAVKSKSGGKFALLGLPVITSSDAHFASDIGVVHTDFLMCAPTFQEMALALRGTGGRSHSYA